LTRPDYNFSMTGKIRRNRENFYIDLLYIDLHWKGERILPFSDRDGNPLYSERQAQRPLERIRSEIDYNDLDPKNYVKRELKALAWPNYVDAWFERQVARGRPAKSLGNIFG